MTADQNPALSDSRKFQLIEDYGDGSEPRVCGTYSDEAEVRRLTTALNLTSLPTEPGDIDGPSYYVRTINA